MSLMLMLLIVAAVMAAQAVLMDPMFLSSRSTGVRVGERRSADALLLC